jgi:H/ACA ribonucleoprotein complex subunit 1
MRGGGGRGGFGGRDGGRGGRGGGFGGRGGGRGFGGRGGYQDQGPPESVVEAGVFAHACEGEAVCKLTNDKVRRCCDEWQREPPHARNATRLIP